MAKHGAATDSPAAETGPTARDVRAPSFVCTPSADRILAALRFAHVAADVAVIYGSAGVGKSVAVRHYAEATPGVYVATMMPASSTVVPALEEIGNAIGISGAGGGAARMHRAIVARLAPASGLLVIDEAQHLSAAALDQVRVIHDMAGVGLALVGNEQVYSRLTGGTRAAYLDRLFSRIGKRVHLLAATAEDCAVLLDAWGIGDMSARRLLTEVAKRPGGLRSVAKVVRLAAMYAADSGLPIGLPAIRAAWAELSGA